MAEILNIAGLHNNGKAEVNVGIRGNQFTIKRENNSDEIFIVDSKTQKYLTINGKDSYTKKEVDNLLSGMMIYIGQYSTIELLKTTVTKPISGMVVFILNAGGTDIDGKEIPGYSHLIYTGSGWRLLK